MLNYSPVNTPDRGRNGTLTVEVSDTANTATPISITDVKNWAKVETNSDDTLIGDLIYEIISHVENTYQIPVISKDVVATWDSFSKQVKLPFTPVSSITTVKTIQTDGDGTQTETTLDENEDYRLVGDSLYFNAVYPYKNPYERVTLEVTYVSAWGKVPNDVLLGLKKAILTNYEDRQDNVGGMNIVEIPNSSKSIFQKYISFDN